jgi:uncharacterized protein
MPVASPAKSPVKMVRRRNAATTVLANKKQAVPQVAIHASRATHPQINERFACFKLKIKPSKIHRFGVFADEQIPKGRKVIEYTGQRLNRKQVAAMNTTKLTYLFTLDKYWTLDGAIGGSGAEFINHSCAPNVRATIFKGHILYIALREVKKGEELLIDYRFGKDVQKIPCGCGAKTCRGTINIYKED